MSLSTILATPREDRLEAMIACTASSFGVFKGGPGVGDGFHHERKTFKLSRLQDRLKQFLEIFSFFYTLQAPE